MMCIIWQGGRESARKDSLECQQCLHLGLAKNGRSLAGRWRSSVWQWELCEQVGCEQMECGVPGVEG